MVSDDACTTFVELLKRILDIINDIEKEKLKGKDFRGKALPKIKAGKLSKAQFKKLQKAGSEFKFGQHRTTIKKAGTQLKSAYLLLITAARANFIKPASFSCQPDRDSPMRI